MRTNRTVLFVAILMMATGALAAPAKAQHIVFSEKQPPQKVFVDPSFGETTPGWGVDHFNGIAEAIEAVAPEGEVHIAPGTYNGNIHIKKSVTLKGNNPETTIVRGTGETDTKTIFVEAGDVTITGLTITNSGKGTFDAGVYVMPGFQRCTIAGNILHGNATAIYALNSHSLIHNNIINDNHRGIWLSGSHYTVSGNTIEKNWYQGIYCVRGHNVLTGNVIRQNDVGITLAQGAFENLATWNEVLDNKIYGFYLANHTSYKNQVHSNRIIGNGTYGIAVRHETRENVIYNNYFDNAANAFDDTEGNSWNIDKTVGDNIVGGPFMGGNFWSDFAGEDTTNDGLGDTGVPYTSENRILNGGDLLPLVKREKPAVALLVAPAVLTAEAGATGAGFYDEGTIVNISVREVDGFIFKGWTGSDDDVLLLSDPESLSASLTMPGRNVVYTATYEWDGSDGYTVTLNVVPDSLTGQANPSGAWLYPEGSRVDISVDDIYGFAFTGWTGDSTDVALLEDATSRETSLIMPGRNVVFTANYEIKTYSVHLATEPSDIMQLVSLTGSGEYEEGSTVTISIVEAGGYLFTGWQGAAGDLSLLSDPGAPATTFSMPARDVTLTAHFDFRGYSQKTYVSKDHSPSTQGWGTSHFDNIVRALAWTGNNGEVMVYPGFYEGNLHIPRSITITGENRETTIVRGTGETDTHAVVVEADDVTITGLTITNSGKGTFDAGVYVMPGFQRCTIAGNILHGNATAIYALNSHSLIHNNIINDNHRGIWLSGSHYTVSGNTIEKNWYQGIYCVRGHNVLTGNVIRQNDVGIALAQGAFENLATSNEVLDNKIYGFYLANHTSYKNQIHSNRITGNGTYGIAVRFETRENVIYNNYFDNVENAFDDTEGNQWNIEKTEGKNIVDGPYLGGNFWSDYQGVDTDGDGIGDTEVPYHSGGRIANGGDMKPLIDIYAGLDNAEMIWISAYPNPARDAIMVRSDLIIGELLLKDAAGKTHQRFIVNGTETSIELTGLLPGLFFLEAIAPQQSGVIRIMVVR